MKILGIHFGHDSNAALIENGKIVADVAEERFKRIKHYGGLPIESIKFCLEQGNIKDINEIDEIALPQKSALIPIELIQHLGINEKKINIQKFKIKSFIKNFIKTFLFPEKIKMPIYIQQYSLKNISKINFVEHHLAHAASAYYTQISAEPSLIITADGIGDGVTIGIWKGENNTIKNIKRYGKESAIGWFYSIVTEGLHWWHGDGEGKTMGLAPYGNREKVKGCLDKYCPKFKNGKIIKEFDLGEAYFWKDTGSYHWHFDEAFEIEKIIKKLGKENVAAEAQYLLEEQMIELIDYWIKKTGLKRIYFSGGIFLNVKLNQKIFEKFNLKKGYIYSNCGDSGLASGAALYKYYEKNKFDGYMLDNLYFGPNYNDEYIENILNDRNINYKKINNIEKTAAKLLAKNKIIGWFQGKMESGPRALGNRSILMSPLKAENKDIINAKVKFRESFRPFCPSLLWEYRDHYFDHYRDEYFMITSFTIKNDKAKKIPAVVHVDKTVRPQMVKKESNPKYWNLIKEFGDLTGEYIILNTSLNILGEPIICHPREAIRCFFDNGLDYLIMENYIISKNMTYEI